MVKRDRKHHTEHEDDAGNLEVDSSGDVGVSIGNGLTIDSDGDVGIDIGGGLTIDSDGDIGFKI